MSSFAEIFGEALRNVDTDQVLSQLRSIGQRELPSKEEVLEKLFAQAMQQKINEDMVVESKEPLDYAQPFCDFLTNNPTVFHACDFFAQKLKDAGYTEVSFQESLSVQT
jgi:hypothetical protein